MFYLQVNHVSIEFGVEIFQNVAHSPRLMSELQKVGQLRGHTGRLHCTIFFQ